MNVELETRPPDTKALFPFKVVWRILPGHLLDKGTPVLPDHLLGMGTPTAEIPAGTRIHELSFKGKNITLILPDVNTVGYDQNNFMDSKRATKLARQIFKYNNETIGIAQSYEEDIKERKELINIIKEQISDVPSAFLKSMNRSLFAYSYHTEKRIRRSENNKPLTIIRNLTSGVLYSKEEGNLNRERKFKNTTAVFDAKISKLLRKYVHPIDETLQNKIGGIQVLKDGYEYFLAGVIENFVRKSGMQKTGGMSDLETIADIALQQKQYEDRDIRITYTESSYDIQKINNEPIIRLQDSLKQFVASQAVYFPF